MTFSIVICTFERTSDLMATLESIRHMRHPEGASGELIVVDSSRTEDTRRALLGWVDATANLPLRVLHEPRRGKAYALNTAVAAARGDILLFTDDDVRVPASWIKDMTQPILSGAADCVAGGVHLAPGLRRPWMQALHLAWMASTENFDPDAPGSMIGANMAISRRVLERVPLFDTELGAGSALGACDDSLFSLQVQEAGYRIANALHCSVEHHFDPTRLYREPLMGRTHVEGHSGAYIAYHWRHETVAIPVFNWLKLWFKRFIKRCFWPQWTLSEGAPEWELAYTRDLHFIQQYRCERRRPRKYTKRGLAKLTLS